MKLTEACAIKVEIDDSADETCVFKKLLHIAKRLDLEVFGKFKDKELYVRPHDSVYRITRRYHGVDKD